MAVRPDVAPLPAPWRHDAPYSCTGPDGQKVINLVANNECVAQAAGRIGWKAGLATNLGAAGTRIATVSARLAHRDVATTLNVYSHSLPAADRAARIGSWSAAR